VDGASDGDESGRIDYEALEDKQQIIEAAISDRRLPYPLRIWLIDPMTWKRNPVSGGEIAILIEFFRAVGACSEKDIPRVLALMREF
jgi:hypothetical protein